VSDADFFLPPRIAACRRFKETCRFSFKGIRGCNAKSNTDSRFKLRGQFVKNSLFSRRE
jgi:hypothetical protein